MQIKSLELSDIRNYQSLDMSFSGGTNILYGDNAQGKTNILEAIYMCASTKSHRGSRDREVIRFGCSEGHIRSMIERDGATYRIDMHLREGRAKGIAVDGVRCKRAAELVGRLIVVSFAPEDLAVVKSGPSERRRFLNMELCQLDPVYLSQLADYNRLLEGRNKVLKDVYDNPGNELLLDVQDEKLAELGDRIIRRRDLFVRDICEMITPTHERITGGRERLTIKYLPNVMDGGLKAALKNNRRKDIALGQTTAGPHKDDFIFTIDDDIDIRRYGSQGQQRTAALSLKLSEIEMVRSIKGENPVLLLDDVLSELDVHRQNDLLSSIGGIQTIITCTGLDEFISRRLRIDRVFRIVGGNVTKESKADGDINE